MKLDSSLQHNLNTKLDALHAYFANEGNIVLATREGLNVSSRGADTPLANRLLTLAGSLLELGAIASHNTAMGHCLHLSIEAEFGHLVIVEVEHPYHPMTLLVTAPAQHSLASVLYQARKYATAISLTV